MWIVVRNKVILITFALIFHSIHIFKQYITFIILAISIFKSGSYQRCTLLSHHFPFPVGVYLVICERRTGKMRTNMRTWPVIGRDVTRV